MQQDNPIPTPEITIPVIAEQPKQSNFLTILLSVLLIVSVTIAVFFAYQTQKLTRELQENKDMEEFIETTKPTIEPVATESSEVDPTANWKTYTNKALGFELKYPPTFIIDKEMNDQFNRATTFKGKGSTFEVMLKTGSGSLDKYYYMDNPDFTKSTLDGKESNIYVYNAGQNCVSDGNGPPCPVSYVVYVSQNSSDFYHLGFFGDNILSDIEKQILSTFRFLN